MVYLISEQVSYGNTTRPIALASTLEELASFLKQRGYYVGSHAQSGGAVKSALAGNHYCYFYWHTGRRDRSIAGTFKILKWVKEMKFRDKYTRADFEIEAPNQDSPEATP